MKKQLIRIIFFLFAIAPQAMAQDNNSHYQLEYYSQSFGYTVTKIDNARLFDCIDMWIGTKYKFSGCDVDGIDCSRFTMMVYNYVFAKPIDGSSGELYDKCKHLKKADLKQGDMVFFKISHRRISHVGVYLGDNKFVHASTSQGVLISDLDEPYYKKYFAGGGDLKE